MRKCSYIIFFAIAIGLVSTFLPTTHISPLLIVMMGLLFGFWLVSFTQDNLQDYIFLLNLFILAFLSRILIALMFYNFVFLKTGIGLSGDAWPYSENGARIFQMWTSGIRDMGVIYKYVLSVSHSGTLSSYDFWNAIVYFFTGGESPLSVVFINCLAGALIVIFIYEIAKILSANRKVRLFAAILTSFWPSTFLWSIQNLKEPITLFLVTILIWIILRMRQRFKFYLIPFAVLAALGLKQLRGFILMVILLTLFLNLLLTSSLRKELRLLLLLSCCITILLFVNKLKSFLPLMFDNERILEWLQRTRSVRAYGGSAFLSNWEFNNLSKLFIFLPLGFLVAWLAPFPWQMGSLGQISGLFEMVIFYLLIPCMLCGVAYIFKNKFKEGFFILMYIFIMSFIMALIEGNIGTIFRHRAMILPFCFIVIAIGLEKYKFRITAHK